MMSLENLSIVLVYGAMAAYTVAMLSFAIDLFGLGSRTVAHKRRAAGIGMSTTWLAALLHLGALVTRTMAAGRVPWANMYEFTLMFTFFVVATFLGLNFARDMRFLGSLVNLLIVLGLGLATSVLYVNAEGVEPILDNYWLIIHVSVATLSTALLYIGAAFAMLQLAQHAAEKKAVGAAPRQVENLRSRKRSSRVRNLEEEGSAAAGASRAAGAGSATAVLDAETDTDPDTGETLASGEKTSPFLRVMGALPSAAKLEIWAYRIVGVGFVTWTFTIIAGAIWAEHAWGRPWGWDPKETWSFVVWIIYAAYLHARATVGWTAEKFAYFLLVGFLALLANFYIVNLFIPGNHSYAF